MKNAYQKVLFLLVAVIAIETTFLAAKSARYISMKKNFHASSYDGDIQKKLAEEYMNQGLYEKAINAYEAYLSLPGLTLDKKANLSYMIGNIYMDNLSDYASAMANFVRAKVFYPQGEAISEINKKIVMCLENMGRPVDAEREMQEATALDKPAVQKSGDNGIIIAKIGDRNITMDELNREIEKLPSFVKSDYKENDKKLEFLKQYIATELLYDSAKRRGLDKDSKIIEDVNLAKKQIMIDKLVRDEIDSKVQEPGESDIKLYYDANKDKYTEEKKDDAGNVTKRQKEFSEVKEAVRYEYISMKKQERAKDFLNSLQQTKDVAIYEANFK